MGEESFAKELLESMKASNERQNNRQHIIILNLIILALVLIIALVGSNCYWIWYNSQWEYETVYVESGEGIAVYNEEGMVDVNGESNCQEAQTENKETERHEEKNQSKIE